MGASGIENTSPGDADTTMRITDRARYTHSAVVPTGRLR